MVRNPKNQLHKKKSIHTGVGTAEQYVRIRHPEFPEDEERGGGRDEISLQLMSPESGVLSLDQPCYPVADTACYLLDGFDRLVPGTGYSNSVDGGAWPGATRFKGMVDDGHAWTYAAGVGAVESYLGTVGCSWVSTCEDGCGGLDFTFSGWREIEDWREYVVPAHPTDLAGLHIGPVTFFAPTGLAGGTVGQGEGAILYVGTEAPTGQRSGVALMILPHNVSTTVFIPSTYIPDEGETLYIGVGPNWTADYGDVTCGFRWPWMDGQGNSARAYLSSYTDTLVWQTWDVAADEWGSGLSDDENGGSWWEGNLPWAMSPPFSGTYGMDGDSLYLTVPSSLNETFTARMDGVSTTDVADDNDDALGEPWTHPDGVAMKARFRVTTAGSLTEAGSRYIEFQWANQRDIFTCQVRVGDTTYGEGLFIADSDQSAFALKDITEGSWMWVKFDARNPNFLRAKMWVEGEARQSQEPPVYDVTLSRNDDAEAPYSGDFFQILMQAGNATGADQTFEIGEVWICGAGDDCEWVEELIGQGDGVSATYATSQPHKKGSLYFGVDGMSVLTTPVSADEGSFYGGGGIAAAQYAILTARYLVDKNSDGD